MGVVGHRRLVCLLLEVLFCGGDKKAEPLVCYTSGSAVGKSGFRWVTSYRPCSGWAFVVRVCLLCVL